MTGWSSTPPPPDLPEPPDRTGLYWPETDEFFASMLVRDDAATAIYPTAKPDQRWLAPNEDRFPMTWAEVLVSTRNHDDNRPISAAIWFHVPPAAIPNGDTP